MILIEILFFCLRQERLSLIFMTKKLSRFTIRRWFTNATKSDRKKFEDYADVSFFIYTYTQDNLMITSWVSQGKVLSRPQLISAILIRWTMMVIWFQVGKIWLSMDPFIIWLKYKLLYRQLLQIPVAFIAKIFHQLFSD